ncbi:carboxymuconolactone decarboxylase family protein [Sulfurimonas sp.]|uniref:carboxymuconolactone decarboxylase family protein n=1 Tax=Sulfurimonas sp. TaxID=2022749 RepID=UPI003D105E61
MAIIKTYQRDEAQGELAEIYKEIVEIRGDVMNSHKIFSSSPELLRQQLEFIKYYANHKTLSLPLLAAIRVLVSTNQKCDFCIDFNTAMLVNKAGWSLDQVNAMREDVSQANLAENEKTMLMFVMKAVKNSLSVDENDMNILRSFGWSDQDILDATSHATRMVAVDLLFNTFKVDSYE